ncbi:ABC transporter permease [Nocardioides marmotae]|uniref:ABC transporter permease subunit n=1 Tax=Nocardioides marmotae TaxID=2663857 RepID=A0A6I3J1X6_9ACTN|nr:ABC transporter permease [Nocardioides marmotae]MCR6030732.1 ABC transporter permease subunit [Gordonia jinghuaiqii]MBC9734003.1 ABC transporter permease [Nocardioides marmotae]MTB85106.1 ABC transporter permease subunit [Nocardioides marmotae]MTB94366.1 ABC transporter permease subunit [Nocardioides marmotae]QKE01607.1 ABC transporter permease [Nocardioides marmotae]
MLVFLARRLAFFGFALVTASILIFVLIRAAGGNVAAVMLGKGATPEAIDALEAELGLDRALPVQYFDWVGGMLTGDFGTSFRTGEPVTKLLTDSLPVSVPLALGGMLLALVIALPVGTYAATKAGTPIGALVAMLSQVGIAIPVFWAGVLLSMFVGLRLGWLPTGGWTPWSTSAVDAARSLVLPALALGMVMAATLSRYTRTAVMDVMNEDFVRTARATGMTRRGALMRVGVRNAALPLVTVVGLLAAELIGGTVIIEEVFSLPGLARMILSAVSAREIIVVQSSVMIIVAFVMLVNLTVDVLYGVLDPRVRVSR